MIPRFLTAAAPLLALTLGAPAFAQDEEPDESIEREAPKPSTAVPSERTKRLIKTLQKKTFLKIGRWEAGPMLGFVTNDPFINRYLFGGTIAYHPTELFAFEVNGVFSPDFGQGDWKPITEQLVFENRVSPDISKIEYFGNANFQFSPIYGKIAFRDRKIINFDIFGVFGTGVVNTKDDLEAITPTPEAEATQVQFHATTNFGGGMRLIFSETVAVRFEGRSMIYIETIASGTLEMKNNFMILGSATFFFPNVDI